MELSIVLDNLLIRSVFSSLKKGDGDLDLACLTRLLLVKLYLDNVIFGGKDGKMRKKKKFRLYISKMPNGKKKGSAATGKADAVVVAPSAEASVAGEKETPGAAAAVPAAVTKEDKASSSEGTVPIQTPYMTLVNKKLRNIAKQLVRIRCILACVECDLSTQSSCFFPPRLNRDLLVCFLTLICWGCFRSKQQKYRRLSMLEVQ